LSARMARRPGSGRRPWPFRKPARGGLSRALGDRWPEVAPLLALLALWSAAALPVEGIGLLVCPFRWVTGVPCAGCGLTRSVIRAARGEWGIALRLHPLGPALCLVLLGTAVAGLLPREQRARLGSWLGRPAVMRTAGIVAIGVLIVNELARLVWIFWWRRPSLW
jgi:Protein of unknown function (DUF2752)